MGFKEAGLRGSLRNVSVGADVIPDSVTNHWPTDAGSGSTLTDAVGSEDLSINGATWQSGTGNGGYYLDYDGTDDYARNTNGAAWDYGTFTWMGWFNPTDLAAEYTIASVGRSSSSDNPNWTARTTSNGDFNFYLNNGDGGGNITIATSASSGAWNFAAVQADNGSACTMYHAVASDADLSTAESQNYDQGLSSTAADLVVGARWDDGSGEATTHFAGGLDDHYFAADAIVSQTDIESVFDDTKGNYS